MNTYLSRKHFVSFLKFVSSSSYLTSITNYSDYIKFCTFVLSVVGLLNSWKIENFKKFEGHIKKSCFAFLALVLYISTSFWVLNAPKSVPKLPFQHLLCKKLKKGRKSKKVKLNLAKKCFIPSLSGFFHIFRGSTQTLVEIYNTPGSGLATSGLNCKN